MGGTIGPGPRGLNATLLDKERQFKAFIQSLFGGDDSSDSIDMGRPMDQVGEILDPNKNYQMGIQPRDFNYKSRVASPPTPSEPDASVGEGFDLSKLEMPLPAHMLKLPQLSRADDSGQLPMGLPKLSRDNMDSELPMGLPKLSRDNMSPAPARARAKAPPIEEEAPLPSLGKQRDLTPTLENAAMLDKDVGGESALPAMPKMAQTGDPTGDLFEDPRTDEWLEHLRSRPQHKDHAGSKLRRFGSGALKTLLGGDFGLGEGPHNAALRDWRESGSGLKEGAEVEQKGNIEGRRRLKLMLDDARHKRTYAESVRRTNQEFQFKMDKLNKLDMPEHERKIEADRIRREHWERNFEHKQEYDNANLQLRNRSVANSERNTDYRIDEGGTLSGRQQKDIDDQALREVSADSRFAEWFNPDVRGFTDVPERDQQGKAKRGKDGKVVVAKPLPSEVKEMISRAMAEAKSRISKRKRNDYSSPYGFDSLDWEVMQDPYGSGEEAVDPF